MISPEEYRTALERSDKLVRSEEQDDSTFVQAAAVCRDRRCRGNPISIPFRRRLVAHQDSDRSLGRYRYRNRVSFRIVAPSAAFDQPSNQTRDNHRRGKDRVAARVAPTDLGIETSRHY